MALAPMAKINELVETETRAEMNIVGTGRNLRQKCSSFTFCQSKTSVVRKKKLGVPHGKRIAIAESLIFHLKVIEMRS